MYMFLSHIKADKSPKNQGYQRSQIFLTDTRYMLLVQKQKYNVCGCLIFK